MMTFKINFEFIPAHTAELDDELHKLAHHLRITSSDPIIIGGDLNRPPEAAELLLSSLNLAVTDQDKITRIITREQLLQGRLV